MTTIQVRATRGEHTLEDAEKLLDTEKIKSAILESVSKATENGEQKVDVVIEVRLDPPRSRTDYRCGRCGQMKRGHVCPVSLSRAKRRSKKRQDDEEEPEAPSHFVLAPAGGRGMPVVPAHPYYHPYRHFDQKMYRAAAAAKVAQTTVLAQGQPAGAAPGQAQIAPAAKEGERTAATSVVLPYPEGEQGTAAAAAAAAVHDPNRQQQGGWMPHPDTQGLPNPFLEHGNLAAASAIPAAYGYAEWDGRHYPEYADAPPGQDPYAYARLGRRVPMMYPQLSREQLAALPVEQGGEWRPPAGQPGAPPAKWAQSQAAAQVQAAPAQPGQAPAPAAAQGQAPAPAAPPQQ